MEDVLHVYGLPYNQKYPMICLDERPCQLIQNVLQPIPPKKGRIKKTDHHYKRNGTCTLFVAFEPHTGRLFYKVYKRRTKKEYTKFMQMIAKAYPEAAKILVVQDNLNTHTPASFYGNLTGNDAFSLTSRFEMHYTPVNASWLNQVEIVLSVICKQCISKRIGSIIELKNEIKLWAKSRNYKIEINWNYRKEDARKTFHKHSVNIA
jgi:hypothetical protein